MQRINEPAFVYEALKVYLMVGGLQSPDRELIRSWMQRDWADNLYPGATNAEGRRLLDENLVAMLTSRPSSRRWSNSTAG